MSILNKLTPEKFDVLYGKLLECGICTWTHVEVLAQGIFDKATLQIPFASMYADLCVRLVSDLCDGACWFRHVLLSRCWENFEGTFQSPTDEADFVAPRGADSDEDAKALRKKRALGTVRFMGELLIRGFLFPEDMFACTEALLRSPTSASCLEALATLLKIVGPYFDDANWTHHSQLRIVFWHIRGILFDPLVSKRVRFLLRDVMDLREAGWVDTKVATKVEQPKKLDEVRKTGLNADDGVA
jgi:translation initiation factor 4G